MATLKQLTQTPQRTYQRTYQWLVLIFLTLIFTGCTRVNAGPPPTRTPIPTFTPSPTYDVLATMVADAAIATATASAPTITPTPTNTETPTVTPTVALAKAVVKSPVNIRVGPSTTHPLMGAAQPGESFTVTAKSNDGAWWQIEYNGQSGWLFGELVERRNHCRCRQHPNGAAAATYRTTAATGSNSNTGGDQYAGGDQHACATV
jgi:hypothetical protein